jgi:hypothetical protein
MARDLDAMLRAAHEALRTSSLVTTAKCGSAGVSPRVSLAADENLLFALLVSSNETVILTGRIAPMGLPRSAHTRAATRRSFSLRHQRLKSGS